MTLPGNPGRAVVGVGRAAAIAMLGLSAFVAGCERNEAKSAPGAAAGAPAAARPAVPVSVAIAVAQDVPVYIDQIGRCMAKESVIVQPQVDGRVTEVHFIEGAMVKTGDLLFSIDPRPFEAAVARADAALAQSRENLTLAQLEWGRVEKLQGTNAMSQSDIDQRRSTVRVNEAQVKSAEAALETAKLNLEYCSIKSPIDGRAGQRLVDAGNIVKANDAKLVVVQAMDPIYADFTVPENDFGTVRKYIAEGALAQPTFDGTKGGSTSPLKVEVEVPADSSKVLAALGAPARQTPPQQAQQPQTQPQQQQQQPQDQNAPATQKATQKAPATQPEPGVLTPRSVGPRAGVLTFLDNSVQDASGTIKLRATVPNADWYFWPGQFVRVRVILTTRKDAILIPVQAIQVGQQGPFVFVVKADSSAELRPVVQGQRQGDQVVIEQGVQAGEQVVTNGQMMIMPGGKVMVTNAATAAGATASASQ